MSLSESLPVRLDTREKISFEVKEDEDRLPKRMMERPVSEV